MGLCPEETRLNCGPPDQDKSANPGISPTLLNMAFQHSYLVSRAIMQKKKSVSE